MTSIFGTVTTRSLYSIFGTSAKAESFSSSHEADRRQKERTCTQRRTAYPIGCPKEPYALRVSGTLARKLLQYGTNLHRRFARVLQSFSSTQILNTQVDLCLTVQQFFNLIPVNLKFGETVGEVVLGKAAHSNTTCPSHAKK